MGMGGQCHALTTLPLGKKFNTHYIGGWVGPWESLDKCRKSHPPPRFDPLTIKPVASRNTN
jgi:hypothetical protein